MSATEVRRRPTRAALFAAAASIAISLVAVALDAQVREKNVTPTGPGPDMTQSPPAQVIDSNIKLAY